MKTFRSISLSHTDNFLIHGLLNKKAIDKFISLLVNRFNINYLCLWGGGFYIKKKVGANGCKT